MHLGVHDLKCPLVWKSDCSIRLSWKGLREIGWWLAERAGEGRPFILADPTPWRLHGEELRAAFELAGLEPTVMSLRVAEPAKTWEQAGEWLRTLADKGLRSDDVLVLFGGSSLCDLGGFIAAVFAGGLPFVHIPTTLTAQVDTAIGGCSALNHPKIKHLIGARHAPRGVFIDARFLRTLPLEDRRHGLAHMVKLALLDRPSTFHELESEGEALLDHLGIRPGYLKTIQACVEAKLRHLPRNGETARSGSPLQLGQTVAHALEVSEAYRGIQAGPALAVGLATAARISLQRGLLSHELAVRIHRLLEGVGLPTRAPRVPAESVWRHIEHQRALHGGIPREVLPVDFGRWQIVDDLEFAEFEAVHERWDWDSPLPEADMQVA